MAKKKKISRKRPVKRAVKRPAKRAAAKRKKPAVKSNAPKEFRKVTGSTKWISAKKIRFVKRGGRVDVLVKR